MRLSYEERLAQTEQALQRRLFEIIMHKQSNLALAADVTTKAELLQLAERLGPHICILKTHIDTITDFDQDLVEQLQRLAQQHQFLLFEDRKFADIGHTTLLQYSSGVYRMVEWADLVTVHVLPGPGILEGLRTAMQGRERGCLVLAEMSSQDNLLTQDYTAAAVQYAKAYTDIVTGFIAQRRLVDDPSTLTLTPGVKLESGKDALGQQYNTPQRAITEQGSDVIIVGRGITQAPDPVASALEYKAAAWQAYLDALQS